MSMNAWRSNVNHHPSLSTVLDLATRNIGRFKSIQRIQESMKMYVTVWLARSCSLMPSHRTINLIAIQAVSKRAISRLPDFLVHPYPRVSDQIPRALNMYTITLSEFE